MSFEDDWPLSYEPEHPEVEPVMLSARHVATLRASVLLEASRLEDLAGRLRKDAKVVRQLAEATIARAADIERAALRLAGLDDG